MPHEVIIDEENLSHQTSQIDTFQRESRPERLRLLSLEAGEKTCRACSGRNWAVAPIREEPRSNPYGESKIVADITALELRVFTNVLRTLLRTLVKGINFSLCLEKVSGVTSRGVT